MIQRGLRRPAGARPARRRALRGRRHRSAPSWRRTAGCWPPSTAARSARCCSTTRGAGLCCAASASSRPRRATGRLGRWSRAAEENAAARGAEGVRVKARGRAARAIEFWEHARLRRRPAGSASRCGSRRCSPDDDAADAEDARVLRRRGWPACSAAATWSILTGDLGAGKTTLTQGIGAGLGVRGEITSPTFVIARVHPLAERGARRWCTSTPTGSAASTELDDLDLDTDLDDAVTVVEWGEGVAEGAGRRAPRAAAAARRRRRRHRRGRGPARGGDPAGRAALARRGAGPHRRAR